MHGPRFVRPSTPWPAKAWFRPSRGAEPSSPAARQVLTIGSTDLDLAELLRVPVGSPVAEVRRVFVDADGRVIYLGEIRYRGDVLRLEMDLGQ